MARKSWFTLQADGPKAARLDILDDIGEGGVTAAAFITALRNFEGVERIDVHVNSQGGCAFTGIALHNALRRHPAEIVVIIEALAASAASLVAMAGDRVVMGTAAFMYLHNPAAVGMGDAVLFEEVAASLRQLEAAVAKIYATKTGLPDPKVRELMNARTWLSAEEAVELGFADETEESLKAVASLDLARWPDAPAALRAPTTPTTSPEDDRKRERAIAILRLCEELGNYTWAADLIRAAAAHNLTVDDVRAELDRRLAIVAMVADSRKSNVAVGPWLSEHLIKEGLSIEESRERLASFQGTPIAPGGSADDPHGWSRAVAKVTGAEADDRKGS